MTRRTPTINPELKAHQEWLGYLQPVGLVVAPAAMVDAGWVVTRSGSELIERQERYREAIQGLSSASDSADPDPEADGDTRTRGFPQLETLLVEHLGWSADQIQSEPALIESYSRHLPELGETLRPTALVPAANREGIQLLLQALPSLAPLDQKGTSGEHLWRATSQERFERLLRETGVEAGLLFNGAQLRLVVAPKGESSGHLTFPLAELGGRLMFAGLELLLGQSPVFLDPDGYRLSDVLKKSRSFQAVVSNALADQVLAALWDLLRGFQRADELSQRQDVELLADLPERDPQQLYGGLITVLMRLVFLLYAEDEALMPADAVYEQNYKVSGIFERLRQDAAVYPDTMEQRYGAWAGLMSLCRLVYAGGGATTGYLPARKGQLFDPGAYRWLETPWISDGVVLSVLSNLLVVKGERISYRALDVEQIGSVYEGIMGYAVRRIPGRCIGLKSKPQGGEEAAHHGGGSRCVAGPARWQAQDLAGGGSGHHPAAQGGHRPEGRRQRSRVAGGPCLQDRPRSVRRPAGGRQLGVPTHRGAAPQRQSLHAAGIDPADRGGGTAALAGALPPPAHSGADSRPQDLRSGHGLGGLPGGVLPLPGGTPGAGLEPGGIAGGSEA